MDIDLSPEDLAFRDEVRGFLQDNAHKPKEDYNAWRLNWFKLARITSPKPWMNYRTICYPNDVSARARFSTPVEISSSFVAV